jgi:hypothetical protein
MDPRVPMTAAQLREQFTLAQKITGLMAKTNSKKYARYNAQLGALLDAVEGADAVPTPAVARAVHDIAVKLQTLH